MNNDNSIEDLEFNNKINTLKHFYKKNPKATMNLLNKIVNDESLYETENNNSKSTIINVINDIGLKKFLYIFLISCYVILGLIDFNFLYFFGIVFFLAGYFVTINGKGAGIVFLFSHGLTGYGIMIYSIISNEFYRHFFEDMSHAGMIYLIILAILAVIGLFILIFYSLSKTLRKNQNIPLISFTLFLMVLCMIKILPFIYFDVIRLFG